MKRFSTFAICLLMLTLMANQCKKEETTDDGTPATERTTSDATVDNILDQLYGKAWYHSREEDKDGVLTYRDDSYKFPPSRGGRTGFKLEKGGKMWEYGTGPADRPTTTEGTWEVTEGKDGIQVKLTKNGTEMSYRLEFVSFEDNILQLKWINN